MILPDRQIIPNPARNHYNFEAERFPLPYHCPLVMSKFPYLTGAEIRQKFLQFYQQRGHQLLPSASLVPEDPTVLLTIAGMLPFKPIFLGQKPAPFPRVTTVQKCIRTNDIENVGRTARHHTFFEMLGNFSFGDYFKREAITWGWELVTTVYQLPPDQLVVSVFHEDETAFAIWRDEIGIPPHRIQRMGEDNFWASGATGPCGPCSEIYFDFHPERGDQTIDLQDDSRFLEIYNLVFMELNRLSDGSLVPLAKQNIDTGMGLERLAQVLQRVPNNYETDLIMPIIDAVSAIAPVPYRQCDPQQQTSFKVIADHLRAVVHMIADGITPSNVGRGYILRRLIRRVVRHGKLVGITQEFINQAAEIAIQLSESVYPEVRQQAPCIKQELAKEEERFRHTLERGEKLLMEVLAKPETQQKKQISGTDAFVLYDTYGFPLELTQEIAQEHNCTVDRAGFDQAMAEQQERSKLARPEIDLLAKNEWTDLAKEIGATEFVGYHQLSGAGIVKALLVDQRRVPMAEAGQKVLVILDQTPFYAEGGGQVADRGVLSNGSLLIQVTDVQKEADLHLHFGWIESGVIRVGDIVNARVVVPQRRRIQAHHSSTHLLQAALQKIVDPKITQAGSLVTAERLRFDFHLSRPVTPEEIAQVEQQVNTWIAEAHQAHVSIMPLEQAKAKGAIAMFGEKYGAMVRVVDFPTVSMELCGGTHVHNTSEIGLFKIVAETGIASGVRRIEAVAGQAVLDYLAVRDALTKELSDRFKAKPEEILDRITALQNELKNTQKQLEALQRQMALQQADHLLKHSETIGQWRILVAELPNTDPEALKTAGEKLSSKLGINSAVVLGTVPSAGKVSLIAIFSPEVIQTGLQAGQFIGEIAKICGGGGGGRPNIAQAGGKYPEKLAEALAVAKAKLQAALTN